MDSVDESLRHAVLALIGQYPGGLVEAARVLGLPSGTSLQNRVYARRGQFMDPRLALQLQAGVEGRQFAEAVAKLSGGVFVRLPDLATVDNTELLVLFNTLYSEVGRLSATFAEVTHDNEINEVEQRQLMDVAHSIHLKLEQLLSVALAIYSPAESLVAMDRPPVLAAGFCG